MDGSNREIIEFDLLIKNGQIIDGTGKPSFLCDIRVKDGIIKKIVKINESAKKIIDAKNHIVSPGFVDIHTHYDGQAIWDSQLAPSSLHGVSTVVMGNCGVVIAPCKPKRTISNLPAFFISFRINFFKSFHVFESINPPGSAQVAVPSINLISPLAFLFLNSGKRAEHKVGVLGLWFGFAKNVSLKLFILVFKGENVFVSVAIEAQ